MTINKENIMLYNEADLRSALPTADFFITSAEFVVANVSIDSRLIKQHGLFFALTNGSRDGHSFISDAIKAKATCIVAEYIPIDAKQLIEYYGVNVIIVKDSLQALTQLAIYNRNRITAKTIAITGNIGKTTVKETMGTVLSKFFNTNVSPKSYNNYLGLPLTIANTSLDCEILVLELGMNHPNEIAQLTQIAKPDISLITTIAPVHTEFFNNIEDIAKAKAEIFLGMASSGITILNKANIYYSILEECAHQQNIKNVLSIGSPDANVYIKDYEFTKLFSTKYNVCFKIKDKEEIVQAETAGISYHNAFNTLFTFAVAKLFRLDLQKVSQIISSLTIVEGRGNIEQISTEGKTITVINDAYNSSPEALQAAIRSLGVLGKQRPESRTVAIVGDMLELGSKSEEYHMNVLNDIIKNNINFVVTVGKFMKMVHDNLPKHIESLHFEETRFLVVNIRKIIKDKDIILFKASRSMKFEVAIDKLYR